MASFVHFIGIGGISMSALAKILLHKGLKVSGSDINENNLTDELIKSGAIVSFPHRKENITTQDLVVYNAAIKEDNPELVAAREKGIKTMERATMLGEIMKQYKYSVAVSGTHGKTTTTSMLTYIMIESGNDPTVTVGGELDILDGNLRIGNSDYFIAESCEYCRSFLKFSPYIGVILNIEADHLDYYKDLDEIIEAFNDFSKLIPSGGALVVNKDDANAMKAVYDLNCKIITIGTKDADFTAHNITYNDFGYPLFDVYLKGNKLFQVMLSVAGMHNVLNSLCTIATAYYLGVDIDKIKQGIEKFRGTKRRFEKKGYYNDALVIDDYAHHPTEIRASLQSARNINCNEIWCIFQPHTYTRTKALLSEFADALKNADHLILTDIYAAREKDPGDISSKDIADKIEGSVYIRGFENIAEYIKENVKPGDIVITMGAGDVVKLGDMIIET